MGPAGDGLGPSEDLPGKGRVNSQVTITQREVMEGLTLEQENSPNSHPTPSSDPETAHHGDRVALSGKETKFLLHLSLWPCGCLSEMSLPESPQNPDPEATFPRSSSNIEDEASKTAFSDQSLPYAQFKMCGGEIQGWFASSRR